jgi:thioredoxin 1
MKLLKFYATWCEPCKALSKVIAQAGDRVTMPVQEIDIQGDPATAIKYGIRSVPVLVVVDDAGTELRRQVGLLTEEKLLEFLGEA